MNSSLPNAVSRLSGERPPGEMPPIDPSSIETDETFAAIISRDATGKLTVGHREIRRSTELTPTAPDTEDPAKADESNDSNR